MWIYAEAPPCVQIPSLSEWYQEQLEQYWVEHPDWEKMEFEMPNFWEIVDFKLFYEFNASRKKLSSLYNGSPMDFERHDIGQNGHGIAGWYAARELPDPKRLRR